MAENDLGAILEDSAHGFGWPITVTDPTGRTVEMVGASDDISQVIDPATGELVSGRSASVALRVSSLTLAGLGLPRAIATTQGKPWLIAFDDIGGLPHTFRVAQSNPDRTIGVVTCVLEAYKVVA
ncbi:MAG: hypothetical protein GY767_22680 [Shimia sp.]|nr:hypothetical protein [Shimia sp.]